MLQSLYFCLITSNFLYFQLEARYSQHHHHNQIEDVQGTVTGQGHNIPLTYYSPVKAAGARPAGRLRLVILLVV